MLGSLAVPRRIVDPAVAGLTQFGYVEPGLSKRQLGNHRGRSRAMLIPLAGIQNIVPVLESKRHGDPVRRRQCCRSEPHERTILLR
jgi:hypothetical protein